METEDIIEAPLAEGAVAFMLRCHAGVVARLPCGPI